jgi:hypothetical protein
MNTLTPEQFFAEFAARSGKTVDFLKEKGFVVARCHHCDYAFCKGLQMLSTDDEKRLATLSGELPL